MKILLLADVKGLGKKGQIVDVSEGYFKNFLAPKKLGTVATSDTLNSVKIHEAAEARKKAEEKASFLAMSKELGSTKEEIFGRPTVVGGEYKVKAVPKTVDGFTCAYEVSFATDKEGFADFTIPMCDFASASDSEDKEKYSYGIFL